MSLRFRGGERLQRGRGIGGLLRLFKSVFSPLVKSAGKTIVKAATSDTGKAVLRNIKDQAIDSAVKLTADAMRGEDMGESLQNEIQQVKRKAADGLESVVRKKKKQNDFRDNSNTAYIKRKKTKYNQPKKIIIKKKDLFDDDE